MTENLHQLELVKLVSEDHLEFDSMFDVDDSGPRPVLEAVLIEIAQLPDDETLVWAPSFSVEASDELDHDLIQQIVREGKPLLAQVLQVVGGRIFIELLPALEFDGNYYVSMEVLN